MSRLPSDVLALVLHRLPVADYIRSGAVCRSWRRATAGEPHRRSTKSPLLMVPGFSEDSDEPDYFRIFSIADMTLTLHIFQFPQISRKEIAGSFNSSIIATDTTVILILDPLTGSEVRLPAPTDPHDQMVEKLVLSPSKSVAVAILLDLVRQYLSFYRVGDGSWSVLRVVRLEEEIPDYFCDVIIHKGVFYLVNNSGSILSFNADEDENLTAHEYEDPSFDEYYPNLWFIQMYLVESLDGNHLLLVCRMINKQSGLTESFKVFRQDEVARRWVEVESLGEVAIFVGKNYSTCVFTRGLPELRGNCVYFTKSQTLVGMEDDFGVFYLDDKSIQQFRTTIPPLFWIMPSSS